MSNVRKEIGNIVRQHLQGNYLDTLTRFSYLDQGAEQFLKLVNSPDYTSYDQEMGLIDRMIPNLSRFSRVVDIGVGNGLKAAKILSSLDCKYLGLDISEDMLQIARESHDRILPDLNRKYVPIDFSNVPKLGSLIYPSGKSENDSDDDSDHFSLQGYRRKKPDLFLLLGNTLTNETDMGFYLMALGLDLLRSRPENQLIVGLELYQDNIEQIVREYNNEENRALTVRPLEILNLNGINSNEGEIDISFNEEQRRIEEWFIMENDKRILLSVTYKPTLDQFREVVRQGGLQEDRLLLTEDESYALALLSYPEETKE